MSTNINAARKIDRALALGWTRTMPKLCGPGKFCRQSKAERRELLRSAKGMALVDNSWKPVVTEGEK